MGKSYERASVRRQMAKPLRIIGLVLIASGLFILFRMVGTDISANTNQQKLQNDWRESVALDNTITDHPMFSNLMIAWFPATQSIIDKFEDSGIDSPVINQSFLRFRTGSGHEDGKRATGRRNEIPYKQPFARIIIPKINLDAIVVQGVDVDALKLGPGHMEETVYPGEVGNMVISGHRVTYSHPFYYLDELKKGDSIIVCTKTNSYTYYVAGSKVVAPNDVSVIQPTDDKILTLTTCNPRFSARTRLVVVAKMDEDVADTILN